MGRRNGEEGKGSGRKERKGQRRKKRYRLEGKKITYDLKGNCNKGDNCRSYHFKEKDKIELLTSAFEKAKTDAEERKETDKAIGKKQAIPFGSLEYGQGRHEAIHSGEENKEIIPCFLLRNE